MNAIAFKKAVVDELSRRAYTRKTIAIYSRSVEEACRFFPDIPPENITLDDLGQYVSHLIDRKRFAPGTIGQIFNALVFAFNEVLAKDFDFSSISRPRKEWKPSVFLTQSEIYKLLQATSNIKHRTFIALLYSCGMDVGQAVRLRVTDLDFKRGKIKIRNLRNRTSREAIVSKYLLDELSRYMDEYRPTNWLFTGRTPRSPLSVRASQAAFERALITAGIDKPASLKSLKYSYVKHLDEQGVPIVTVLKDLGIKNPSSLAFYSKLGQPDSVAIHNPLDRIISPDDEAEIDLLPLQRMLGKVKDEDERDYLSEAIQCLTARSLRAGIIFAWCAAVQNVRKKCIVHTPDSINSILKRHNPKSPDIKNIDDFVRINDSLLLLLATDLGVLDKNQKDILEGCLDLRNKCGHPSKYRPRLLKAASFVEDLLTIIFR